MLALHGAIAAQLRRACPPNGVPYRVFDLAFTMLVATGCVYARTGNPDSAAAAWLGHGLQYGALIVVALCAVAIACAYKSRTLPIALGLTSACAFVWSLTLLIGVIVDFRWETLGLAVVYGYFARQAWQIAATE